MKLKLTGSIGIMVLALTASFSHGKELPVEHFFKNFEFTQVTISPNGEYLAALAPLGKRRNLVVIDLATRKAKAVTALKKTDVMGYLWANDERLLFYLEKDGNESFGLYAVDRDGTKPRELAGAGGGVVFMPRYTRVIDRLKDDPNHVLVINNKRHAFYPDIYRINVWTNAKKRVARNPGDIVSWIPDQNGRVRAAIATDKNLHSKVLYRQKENSDWSTLFEYDFLDENIVPLSFGYEEDTLYVQSNIGRDKYAVYKYDLKQKRLGELVFSHDAVDVGQTLFSDHRRKLLGIRYETDRQRTHYVDEDFEAIGQALDRALPDTINTIVSASDDESRMIVHARNDRTPGSYYLFRRDKMQVEKLVDVAEWIKADEMAEMHPITYTSRDGLTIHGYLTLPKDSSGRNLPLIVHPHGGPYARDSWQFNREIQFLANRGYAVLQMEFRGSAGYGKRFLERGYKRWGLEMQDDITDAVLWAIKEGIADRNRICIYGASYGGYATMAGITSTPDLYKCAINYVGVVDLFMFHDWVSRPRGPARAWIKRIIGDPDNPEDARRMRATSPVFQVDKIKVPLMVVHGERDPRVEIKQARKLITALKKNDKPFVKLIKSKEGHGFRAEENRIELYRMMDEFLQKHL